MSTSLLALALGLSTPAVADPVCPTCPGGGVTYTVTSYSDSPDLVIDGICKAVSGNCTLRAAIDEANASTCGDTIVIPPWTGEYTLSLAGVEDGNAGGDLDVELCPGELLLIRGGLPYDTKLNGGDIDRVFDVRSRGSDPVLGPATLQLQDFLIRNGSTFDEGGGIRLGKGVDLELQRVAVEENFAALAGGGIYAPDNDLRLIRSTLAHNQTSGDGGGLSMDDGFLLMERCTVSRNEAHRGGGVDLQGSGGATDINGVTFADNKAEEGGGIRTSRDLFLANSIVADNTATDGPDCFTTGAGIVRFFASYWTILTSSCVNDQGTGLLTQASPGLDPLGYVNPTIQAHCPPSTSPVVDTANDDPLLGPRATLADQYGAGWGGGGGGAPLPDMGACES